MVTLHRLLYVTQLHFYYTILANSVPSRIRTCDIHVKSVWLYHSAIGTNILFKEVLTFVESVGIEPLLVCPRYGCNHYNSLSLVGPGGLEPLPEGRILQIRYLIQ